MRCGHVTAGEEHRSRLLVGQAVAWHGLLAGPATEHRGSAEATLAPGGLVVADVGEVIGAFEDARGGELVGRKVAALAGLAITLPAPRGDEARDRKPFAHVLGVVPGVEFLLHADRRFGQREQQAHVRAHPISTIRLPSASTRTELPGSITVVQSSCSMMAGPAKAASAGSFSRW